MSFSQRFCEQSPCFEGWIPQVVYEGEILEFQDSRNLNSRIRLGKGLKIHPISQFPQFQAAPGWSGALPGTEKARIVWEFHPGEEFIPKINIPT